MKNGPLEFHPEARIYYLIRSRLNHADRHKDRHRETQPVSAYIPFMKSTDSDPRIITRRRSDKETHSATQGIVTVAGCGSPNHRSGLSGTDAVRQTSDDADG